MVILEKEYKCQEKEIMNDLNDYVNNFGATDKGKLEEIFLKAFRRGVVLASQERDLLKKENIELKKQYEEYKINSQAGIEEVSAMRNRLKRILGFVIDEM